MDGNHGQSTFRFASTATYLVRTIAARNFVILSRALEPHGIGPVGWRVLAALRENDGCNIAHLADVTATDRSNLGRVIVQLEREGLVSRRPAPRDRRNILLSLTEAGLRKLEEEVLPVVLRTIDRSLVGFSAEELGTLMALLRRMSENVHRASVE
jgi:DNA-binding MarR family transcriptional regulator